MAAANMPGTRMVTASVKFTSIPWKGSGRCCAPGYARTAAFPRRSCPSIWASFNSSTIPASAAKPCSAPSLPPWSHDQTATTPQSRKSLARYRNQGWTPAKNGGFQLNCRLSWLNPATASPATRSAAEARRSVRRVGRFPGSSPRSVHWRRPAYVPSQPVIPCWRFPYGSVVDATEEVNVRHHYVRLEAGGVLSKGGRKIGPVIVVVELWRKLGDDEVRKVAYRGRCLTPARTSTRERYPMNEDNSIVRLRQS